jgi:hypothetical protein
MNALLDAPVLDPVDAESAEAQKVTPAEGADAACITDDSDFPITTQLLATKPLGRHWGINE